MLYLTATKGLSGDVGILAIGTGGPTAWDSHRPLKKVTFGMMYMLAQEQFFRMLLEGKGEGIICYIQLGCTTCLGSYKHTVAQLWAGFFRNRLRWNLGCKMFIGDQHLRKERGRSRIGQRRRS